MFTCSLIFMSRIVLNILFCRVCRDLAFSDNLFAFRSSFSKMGFRYTVIPYLNFELKIESAIMINLFFGILCLILKSRPILWLSSKLIFSTWVVKVKSELICSPRSFSEYEDLIFSPPISSKSISELFPLLWASWSLWNSRWGNKIVF